MSQKSAAPRLAADVLTTPEAAAAKGVHRNSVLKAIRKGHLEARKSGKTWIIDRISLERWNPKRAASQPRPTVQPREASVSRVSGDAAAERRARRREMLRLLDEWMADESGHDEETWPRLKEVLDQDRLSSQKLFTDGTP